MYKIQVGIEKKGRWDWRDMSFDDFKFPTMDEALIVKEYLESQFVYEHELRVVEIIPPQSDEPRISDNQCS